MDLNLLKVGSLYISIDLDLIQKLIRDGSDSVLYRFYPAFVLQVM